MTQTYTTLFLGFIAVLVIALGILTTQEATLTYEEQSPLQSSDLIPIQHATSTDEIEMPVVENIEPEEERKTEVKPAPVSNAKPLPSPPATVTIPQVILPPITQPATLSFDTINTQAREALVNILCIAEPGSKLPSFTGSGIIIDPRGIILTNAHVAERILLKDYGTPNALKCIIRNGSPARDAYYADLMYLPPSWVDKNISLITDPAPTGTGENDYAFLHIVRSATESPLPTQFPYIPIDMSQASLLVKDPVLVAAYPAGFLSDRSVHNALYPVTTITTIKTLYTFVKETLDLISLGGNPVSQKGSSGGGTISAQGKLVALIVTSTDAETTGDRELGAITTSHISRSLLENNGTSVSAFLAQDPTQATQYFQNSVAPALTEKLSAEYDKL